MHAAHAEIDQLAHLCSNLHLQAAAQNASAQLLEPIADALGAESAVFRCVAPREAPADATATISATAAANASAEFAALPRFLSIASCGMPARADDAYLNHFCQVDPVLRLLHADPQLPLRSGLLENRLPDTVAASPGWQRYRREFLLPNGMVHHVGFLLHDPQRRLTWLFNFHRGANVPAFDALAQAKARMVAACLQGQVQAAVTPNSNTPSNTGTPLNTLSARERVVAEAVMQGLGNKQIAQQLGISTRTVENHLRSIYARLGVHSRTQLAALRFLS